MARKSATESEALAYANYSEFCGREGLNPILPANHVFMSKVCAIGPEMIPYQEGQDVWVYNSITKIKRPIGRGDIKPLSPAQLQDVAKISRRLQKWL